VNRPCVVVGDELVGGKDAKVVRLMYVVPPLFLTVVPQRGVAYDLVVGKRPPVEGSRIVIFSGIATRNREIRSVY
jgi:hypothetical protein